MKRTINIGVLYAVIFVSIMAMIICAGLTMVKTEEYYIQRWNAIEETSYAEEQNRILQYKRDHGYMGLDIYSYCEFDFSEEPYYFGGFKYKSVYGTVCEPEEDGLTRVCDTITIWE